MIRDCLLITNCLFIFIMILYIINLKSCVNKLELESFQQSQQSSPDITSLNNIVNILSTAVDSNNGLIIAGAAVPIGTVIIWFKDTPPQPEICWKICDGANGAPNFMNKFPLQVNGNGNGNGNVNNSPSTQVALRRHSHTTTSAGAHDKHLTSGSTPNSSGNYTACCLDSSLGGKTFEWNIFQGHARYGDHTHPISETGEDSWQLNNYPPYITVKYYIRVNPSTGSY